MARTYTLENAPASLRAWVLGYLRSNDETTTTEPEEFGGVDVVSLGITDDDTYVAVIRCHKGYWDIGDRVWAGYWAWECVHGSSHHQLWDTEPDINEIVTSGLRHRSQRNRFPAYPDPTYRPQLSRSSFR